MESRGGGRISLSNAVQSTREPIRRAASSANLPLVEERTASAEVRALFSQYRERFGKTDLPGIVLCFATNPALLNAMLRLAEEFLFGESLLSRRQKEMIAVFVSRENDCAYCADSHGVMLREQGATDEVVCALQQGNLGRADHYGRGPGSAAVRWEGRCKFCVRRSRGCGSDDLRGVDGDAGGGDCPHRGTLRCVQSRCKWVRPAFSLHVVG